MKKSREEVEAKVFFIAAGILLVLFAAWIVYAFIDFGAAIGLLFILAAILVGVILVILAAAWIADTVGDFVGTCCGR